MNRMTITEALAELHVIDKRLAAKREFVRANSMLDVRIKDPFGDTSAEITKFLQAITDLELRRINIRTAIASANAETEITVGGETRFVSEWLVWKREVGPKRLSWLKQVAGDMARARKELQQQLTRDLPDGMPKPGLDAKIDEKWLGNQIENLEEQLERLDGQLSLKNATTFVEV